MTRPRPVRPPSAARPLVAIACALLACAGPAPVRAADAPPPAAEVAGQGVAVGAVGGAAMLVGAEALARLPRIPLALSYETDQGTRRATFEGPLLWDVLAQAGAVDPASPRDQVRAVERLEGRDGYVAVLALGEVAPGFEGKQVILADRMDGKPLPPEHWRIVVPGDRRGGRGVRDVARITVAPAP